MPSLEAQATATRVMLQLTGRRWTFPLRRVVEKYFIPETVDSVNLVGRPVSGVNSAVDVLGNTYTFELSSASHLYFPTLKNSNWVVPWPTYDSQGGYYPWVTRFRGTEMTIDYVYGNPPPLDVQRAIDQIAVELDAAANGGDCNLPQRVTSVVREGVSWTVLDPQQFLVGGKTGLYYPDLILSAYNGPTRVMSRAKVYSPEYRPPRRISTVILDPNTT